RPNPTQHKPDWRSDCAFRIETDHNRHVSTFEIVPRPSITIIGGGPGGYEAALVASKFGADVTLIERNGIGGSAVLTDVLPSKTLISAADSCSRIHHATN